MFGIPVRTSLAVPRYARRWEFPSDRFVEYEESDEVWAKRIGFGRYVDTNEPGIYLLFGAIYVHPDSLKDLEKVFPTNKVTAKLGLGLGFPYTRSLPRSGYEYLFVPRDRLGWVLLGSHLREVHEGD